MCLNRGAMLSRCRNSLPVTLESLDVDAMELNIEHEPSAHRFTAMVEGYRCLVEYRLAGGVMTITYTGVPEPIRHRGIAAQLVLKAFETARAQRWQVVPACSYAAAIGRRHPEFSDLIIH